MGSKSKSSSAQSTEQTDNRIAAGEGAIVTAAGARTNVSTSFVDNTRTVVNNADAARINASNVELLKDISLRNSDTVKAVAGLSANTLASLGESFTDLASLGSQNQLAGWQATLKASGGLLDSVLGASERNSRTAEALGQAAISGFMPAENKNSEVMKFAAVAAAGVAAVVLLRK